MKIFFDGGCRPNPGAMEVAAVARGIVHIRRDIGIGDNGAAEWLALLFALEIASGMSATDVIAIGDSAMVVDQANGRTKVRGPALQRHHAAFVAAAAGFVRLRVRHVRRSHNLAGIALDRARSGAIVHPPT